MKLRFAGVLSLVCALSLTACGGGSIFKDEVPPLKGERISILELQRILEPDDKVLDDMGLVTPKMWKNDFWPQSGGYPNHAMQNLVLSEGEVERIWSADIGQGSKDGLPLTAQPVLVDGFIYTLDTDGRLSAFELDKGKRVWDVDVSNAKEDDPVISGGLAFAHNLLFVTNGYSEVLAVSPENGAVVWRQTIPAPSRAAPTVMNERVFVTTLDSRLLALNVSDGSVLWDYTGINEDSALIGAASAAANNDIVVPVFSSGEVTALRVENGSVAWSDSLASIRGFGGLSAISDIKALPVLDKGIVIAIGFGGRMVAIDERSGARIWSREIGGVETPWVAGNHVFVISSENQLIALGRDTGAIRWIKELPRYEDEELLILSGPIFAGGRLMLFSNKGLVFEFDPETGEMLRQWDSGHEVLISPIVAGGRLYLLDEDGTLSAYQ